MIALVGLLTPFFLLLLTLAIEIGNWYEHKRHLQIQVDAAALAARHGAGPVLVGPARKRRREVALGDAPVRAVERQCTRRGSSPGS